MDHTLIGGDMSPQYVPRKRRCAQSQPKSPVPCPVVQRMPDRACELSVIGHSKNDESQAQDALKMKRTYARRRYEDLQSASIGTIEYPTTSCAVMMSSGIFANGADPGSLAPPTTRLPPRLVAKDAWPQGPEVSRGQAWTPSRERAPEAWAAGRERAQEQVWNSGRDRAGHSSHDHTWTPGRDREQAWTTGRDRGPEQAWTTGRDRVQDQAWNPSRDLGRDRAPAVSWSSRDRQEHFLQPDLILKRVQRVEMERTYPQAPEGSRDSGSDSVGVISLQSSPKPSTSQAKDEQKFPVLSTKREPPTYPPGSQEERWQLQIVARGRVNCPKCKSVSRKTVEGLKKHMDNCQMQPFTCQHCGKQLKSSTGMKYHVMADHSHLPSPDGDLDERAVKEKLRKILKRLGKLKCSRPGCQAGFSSIMGYLYHMKKCGKEECELEKLLLNCSHCGKAYRSRAGLEYHLKTEHAPSVQPCEEDETVKTPAPERTSSGRLQRASAQLANFHLAEIAHNDLPKDWPKKKFRSDLVPDDKKLKYTRPGLPAFSQDVLRKWKNEVKLQRKVLCPNQGCGCIYTSVSGLKAHLGLCTKGDFEAGKYRCLICSKEFNSESGVKYHITSIHSQDWFVTNKKASKKFEKFLKNQPKELVHNVDKQIIEHYHRHHLHHHLLQHHHHHHHHHQPEFQHEPIQPHLHHAQIHQHQAQIHQHIVQIHHPENHLPENHLHQQMEPHSPATILFAPLEPPVGPMWVDLERRGAGDQAPMEMGITVMDKPGGESSGAAEGRRRERGKSDGKRKDCFAGGGGSGGLSSSSSSSSSNTGSSSSESEVEQLDRQRQMEQWNLKRPDIMEAHPEVAAKRQRKNT